MFVEKKIVCQKALKLKFFSSCIKLSAVLIADYKIADCSWIMDCKIHLILGILLSFVSVSGRTCRQKKKKYCF
jgi:hypothetical protein